MRAGPVGPAQPRAGRPLPHGRFPLPPPARRVVVPAGPDAVANVVRRAAATHALPGQAVSLQRLPGQDRLHPLAARPGDHPPDRAVATLRGGPIPPGAAAGADRPCHAAVGGDGRPAPPAWRSGSDRSTSVRLRFAGTAVQRALPAYAIWFLRRHRGHRASRHPSEPHDWASDRKDVLCTLSAQACSCSSP